MNRQRALVELPFRYAEATPELSAQPFAADGGTDVFAQVPLSSHRSAASSDENVPTISCCLPGTSISTTQPRPELCFLARMSDLHDSAAGEYSCPAIGMDHARLNQILDAGKHQTISRHKDQSITPARQRKIAR